MIIYSHPTSFTILRKLGIKARDGDDEFNSPSSVNIKETISRRESSESTPLLFTAEEEFIFNHSSSRLYNSMDVGNSSQSLPFNNEENQRQEHINTDRLSKTAHYYIRNSAPNIPSNIIEMEGEENDENNNLGELPHHDEIELQDETLNIFGYKRSIPRTVRDFIILRFSGKN
uniref:Uncharacterized protein n=1 Tax=Meloidogyne hapla TaxID=6305 RepID=A0A1I8BA51_MELHA